MATKICTYLGTESAQCVSYIMFLRFCRLIHGVAFSKMEKRVDTCDICYTFLQKAKSAILNTQKKNNACQDSIRSMAGCKEFFSTFKSDSVYGSAQYLKDLLEFVRARSEKHEVLKALPFDLQLSLPQSCKQFCTFVRKYVRIFEGWEDHHCRASRQHEEFKRLERSLPMGHALVHADYMENPSVAQSPEEPGACWFATSRRRCILIGIHVRHAAESTEANPCTLKCPLYSMIKIACVHGKIFQLQNQAGKCQ